MKYSHLLGAGLLAVLMGGCASPAKFSPLQPVGPAPARGPETVGSLQVFSAREKALAFLASSDLWETEETRYELAHTDYAIHACNGALIREVCNARHRNDETPAEVALAGGRYRVVAEAQTHDDWTLLYDIPVVIEPGRKTVIHLEPGWRPDPLHASQCAWVRGHDGRLIGCQVVEPDCSAGPLSRQARSQDE